MSTPFKGLCGPSYHFTNRYAAIERSVNWYPVANESQDASAFTMMLAESPRLKVWSQGTPGDLIMPCRGMIDCGNFGLYVVLGDRLVSMTNTGAYSIRPFLSNSTGRTNPVSMVQTGTNQIFIADGPWGYAFNLNTATLTVQPAHYIAEGGHVTFQDGYILALSANITLGISPKYFQISGDDTTPIGDCTIWDEGNISNLTGQADNLQNIISSREYVRILGTRRSQIFYNAGANGLGGFPFQSYNETFIETGLLAPWSLSDFGDSLGWIGSDQRGVRAAWRDFGFQPQRISTFAIEQTWATYATKYGTLTNPSGMEDAIAFTFTWQGHTIWQITFPTANATWAYDATMSLLLKTPVWHERDYHKANGQVIRRPELFHAYAYGKHLVAGDGVEGNIGTIYEYTDDQFTEDGDGSILGSPLPVPFVPRRICPHISDGRKNIVINRLRATCQQGVGNVSGPGMDPQLYMKISRDGGNTYGREWSAPLGKTGEYDKITEYLNMGMARNWVFDIYGGDPVAYSLVSGDLDMFECAS